MVRYAVRTIWSTGVSKFETFPNPHPQRDYRIEISAPEFTSLCPKTGLPDFGEIFLSYIPGPRCVELKSYKYYLLEYRNRGAFYEDLTNQILNDLVQALDPKEMRVEGRFTARGGITTTVIATYPGNETLSASR